MNPRDLFKLVLQNLIRLKFRAILTTLGVVIGTGAIVVMISLGVGMQKSAVSTIQKEFGEATQLTVTSFGSMGLGSEDISSKREQFKKKTRLDDKALTVIKGIEGVLAVMPQLEVGNSEIKFKRYSTFGSVVGVEPHQMEKFGFKIAKGKRLTAGKKAVVGAKIPEIFFIPGSEQPLPSAEDLVNKPLRLMISKEGGEEGKTDTDMLSRQKGKTIKVKVAGVLQEKGMQQDYSIYIPFRKAREIQKQLGRKAKELKEYQSALVKVDSPVYVDRVEKKIKEMGLTIFSLKDVLKGVKQFFAIIQAVLGGIAAIALIVASLGITNTMTMAVYERTREIGIIKALGASNQSIMNLFLTEAGVIGFMGGIFGVVLGFLGGQIINLVIKFFAVQQGTLLTKTSNLIYTPFWLVILSIVFATFLGLFSGVFPALRAAKLNPLIALRHE